MNELNARRMVLAAKICLPLIASQEVARRAGDSGAPCDLVTTGRGTGPVVALLLVPDWVVAPVGGCAAADWESSSVDSVARMQPGGASPFTLIGLGGLVNGPSLGKRCDRMDVGRCACVPDGGATIDSDSESLGVINLGMSSSLLGFAGLVDLACWAGSSGVTFLASSNMVSRMGVRGFGSTIGVGSEIVGPCATYGGKAGVSDTCEGTGAARASSADD